MFAKILQKNIHDQNHRRNKEEYYINLSLQQSKCSHYNLFGQNEGSENVAKLASHIVLVHLTGLLDLGQKRNSPPQLAGGLDNLDLYLFLNRLEV